MTTSCRCALCLVRDEAPADDEAVAAYFASLPRPIMALLASIERVRSGKPTQDDIRSVERAAEQCDDLEAQWRTVLH